MLKQAQQSQAHMFDRLYWDDPYPIALALKQLHPYTNPVELSLQTLQHWVTALEEFADDKDVMPIERLEEIQVEWLELRD